jgi:hypothetical protein
MHPHVPPLAAIHTRSKAHNNASSQLARWARKLSWKETAESFHTSWDKVCHAVEDVVGWGPEHRTLEAICAIGVDEIHYAKCARIRSLSSHLTRSRGSVGVCKNIVQPRQLDPRQPPQRLIGLLIGMQKPSQAPIGPPHFLRRRRLREAQLLVVVHPGTRIRTAFDRFLLA